jgi:hypothetical protein
MTVPGPEAAVQAAEPAGAKPSPVQREEPRRPEAEDEDRPRRRSHRVEDDEDEDDRPRRRSRREADDEEDEDRPRRRRWRDDEEDDYDRRREPEGTSGKAVAALVLGLLVFCVGLLAGIPAIILGVLSLNDIKRSRGRLGGRGLAIAGVVLGSLSVVLSLLAALLVPAVFKVREAAARIQSSNNLKQMALAMHNYNDKYGHLPEAIPDPKLQGPTKLSWRVALLPYLEQDNLYRQFHHNEPWDSPHNKTLLTQMPKVFAHPGHPEENAQGLTYYRVFTGEHAPFAPGRPARIPASFPDGLSNTILIVEAADPVPWTKPDELAYDPNKPLPRLGGHSSQGTGVAMGDGFVVFVPATVSETTLRRAIDPADGQPLGADWPR